MSDSDAPPPRSPSRRRNIRRGGAQDRRAEGEARANLPAVIAVTSAGSARVTAAKAGVSAILEMKRTPISTMCLQER